MSCRTRALDIPSRCHPTSESCLQTNCPDVAGIAYPGATEDRLGWSRWSDVFQAFPSQLQDHSCPGANQPRDRPLASLPQTAREAYRFRATALVAPQTAIPLEDRATIADGPYIVGVAPPEHQRDTAVVPLLWGCQVLPFHFTNGPALAYSPDIAWRHCPRYA